MDYGTRCPNCDSEVFKQFPKGFVDEYDEVACITARKYKVRENWHCPGCGHWEHKYHYIDGNGNRIEDKKEPKIESEVSSNTSEKPKKKRKKRSKT